MLEEMIVLNRLRQIDEFERQPYSKQSVSDMLSRSRTLQDKGKF